MAGHWKKSETFKERFLKYVDRDDSSGCWIWKGNIDHYGYGRVGYKMKTYRASRASYIIFKDQDPGNLFVCHKCDNPSCVNPDHLFLGSQKDNMVDCKQKKRTASGSRNGMAKLSEDQIGEIKSLLKSGQTHQEIGKKFGVSRSNIGAIANGLRWQERWSEWQVQA